MARGWESKAIEAQQEEATRKPTVKPRLTEQQLQQLDRRRILQLSRARAMDDLSRARSEHHRRMLEQAIQAIDDQLARLS